jgi:hypothetical protein
MKQLAHEKRRPTLCSSHENPATVGNEAPLPEMQSDKTPARRIAGIISAWRHAIKPRSGGLFPTFGSVSVWIRQARFAIAVPFIFLYGERNRRLAVLASLEIVVGVVFLLTTIVSFWMVLPRKSWNRWLLKHSSAETMFPLFIMLTLAISVAAFVVAFR